MYIYTLTICSVGVCMNDKNGMRKKLFPIYFDFPTIIITTYNFNGGQLDKQVCGGSE